MTQHDLAVSSTRSVSGSGVIGSGEHRLDIVEFVAFAKALKVDPIELFTRFVRSP